MSHKEEDEPFPRLSLLPHSSATEEEELSKIRISLDSNSKNNLHQETEDEQQNAEITESNTRNTNDTDSLTSSIIDSNSTEEQEDEHTRPTPMPYAKLIVVATIILADAYTITVLFPFVGFMVQDFGLVDDDSEAGYFAGFIASSYFLGQFFLGFFWGWLSDRIGRRPVLLFGLTANMSTLIAFGLSRNIFWAVSSRFMAGLLNNNFAIAKTYIGEVTDSTNQAGAFSMVGLCWGIGCIVGPAIGGVLSRLAIKYPDTFSPDGFLGVYAYFPPCMCGAVLIFCCIISTFFLLPETRHVTALTEIKQKLRRMIGMDVHQPLENSPDRSLSNTASENNNDNNNNYKSDVKNIDTENDQDKIKYESENGEEILKNTQESKLSNNEDNNNNNLSEYSEDEHEHVQNDEHNEAGKYTSKTKWQKIKEYFKIMTERDVLVTVSLYGIRSLMQIGYDEVLPLWALKRKEKGGLGFGPSKIGIIQTITGISLIIFQVFFYHRLAARFGKLRLWKAGLLLFIPLLLGLPFIHYLNFSEVLVWIGLTIAGGFRAVTGLMTGISIIILINNSTMPEYSGAVNGAAQSFASFSRAFGPTLGGALFAWSSNNNLPYPFDQNLLFWISATMCLGIFGLSFMLRPSIDIPKPEAIAKAKKEQRLESVNVEEAENTPSSRSTE